MKQRRSRGFTLLELLMVMLLLGIVMGMAGFTFARDPQRMASQEANLFLQLVQYARQQAVLERQALGIRIDGQGYQLLRAFEDDWVAAGKRRDIGLGLRLRLEIDGLPVPHALAGAAPQLLMYGSDEHTPFSLHFEADNVRLVSVSSDGLNDPQFEY
ncbi:type II secretion system minor pseudopilin GspH [Pseudomonas sp. NPDC089407]|uniref:type II secretion system minor pseudopilin GspH n=1 Tax=Pseudomonas sp. NPDC089407 TaxID=3364464 RepID=UPI0038501B7C